MVVQCEERAELSSVMSSGGDAQGPDARRDNSAKGHPRLSHYPPIAVACRWPPTTANIRCACECSCLMVIMLLRDTRTVVINDTSLLSLPLKPRKNGFIYLERVPSLIQHSPRRQSHEGPQIKHALIF